MSQPKIMAVQMTSRADWKFNREEIGHQLASQNTQHADIVVLPEMFSQFGESNAEHRLVESPSFDGDIGRQVREWARRYNVWIIAGTVPVSVPEDEQPRARCFVIDNCGDMIAKYDKIHLFDANVSDNQRRYRESDSYSAGSEVVSIETPWGKMGLAVCYDLRFPELFRQLNDDGAEFVIVPSAFTAKTGEAHWQVLCRARAIENGYYLVAVNQCGLHDEKRSTWGHTMMVDPWGGYKELDSEPGSVIFKLDLTRNETVRSQLPVNTNRRLR